MKYEIPKYLPKQLDARITLCVSREMKDLWDKYTREEKLKLPETLRKCLKDILSQLAQ